MDPDAVAQLEVERDADVMASVEEGDTDTLIVADISTDDAYITLPLADAASLPAWR